MTVAAPPARDGVLRRLSTRRGTDGERGATSVELVIYTPLLMLVVMIIVQVALVWQGNQVAGAVAREAARVARAGGGTPAAFAEARTRAVDYADAVGGRTLRDVRLDVDPVGTDEVEVTVSGAAIEVVPGLVPQVTATVRGPLETFRPDL